MRLDPDHYFDLEDTHTMIADLAYKIARKAYWFNTNV